MEKTLILIRGISGSGKTTVSSNLLKIDKIISTDDYFIDEKTGEYKFDPDKLSENHSKCLRDTQNFMIVNDHYGKIGVHNTFTQEWEMKPYFELGDRYDYNVVTIVVEKRHRNKSIHNVPDNIIQLQKDRFEIHL